MSGSTVETMLEQVEEWLALAGELPEAAERAVGELLNLVEALCSDRNELADEVARLRKQLEKKKKTKTTGDSNQNNDPSPQDDSNHSSDKRRKQGDKKPRKQRDRRSFKDLTIHETIECPVDLDVLPPDAVRVEDESVIVQDIEIRPRNIRFQRSVYYSAAEKKFFRGPLPSGYDVGDFGANLRALILSLKYCGNMSEPKIREFLENFDVQISAPQRLEHPDQDGRRFRARVQRHRPRGPLLDAVSTDGRHVGAGQWPVLAHAYSVQSVLCGLLHAAAQRSPDRARSPAKHERIAIPAGRRNIATAAGRVRHSGQMATRSPATGRSRVRQSLARGAARRLVRRSQPASPNDHRTGGGDCLLSSSNVGAVGRNDRL